jgi:hypothetical protein
MRLDHLHVNIVPLSSEMLREPGGAQMLGAGAHPNVALTRIIRDKKKPYFHLDKIRLLVAPLTLEVNANDAMKLRAACA